jgi:predicted HTH domain antitoxin
MPLIISDDELRAAGLTEQEAKIEIACRWFDSGKLTFGHALQLAALSESEFETQLHTRGIPRHKYTEQMLDQDVAALKKLGRW